MLYVKQDKPKKKNVELQKECDKIIARHRQLVNQNKKQHLKRVYCSQFYETFVANGGRKLDQCSVQDLRTIPAQDFLQLCSVLDNLSLEQKKNQNIQINPSTLHKGLKGTMFGQNTEQSMTFYAKRCDKMVNKLKISSHLLKKSLNTLCTLKVKELNEENRMKIMQKQQEWRQVDKKMSSFRDQVKKADQVVIREETVQFLLQLFREIKDLVEEFKDELVIKESKQKPSKQIKEQKNQQKPEKQKIEENSHHQSYRCQRHLHLHLHLTHLQELIKYYLEDYPIEPMSLHNFCQMISYFLAIANEFIEKTVLLLSPKLTQRLSSENIPVFEEIQNCFEVIRRDENLDNPRSRRMYEQQLSNLLEIIGQIFSLLKHFREDIAYLSQKG